MQWVTKTSVECFPIGNQRHLMANNYLSFSSELLSILSVCVCGSIQTKIFDLHYVLCDKSFNKWNYIAFCHCFDREVRRKQKNKKKTKKKKRICLIRNVQCFVCFFVCCGSHFFPSFSLIHAQHTHTDTHTYVCKTYAIQAQTHACMTLLALACNGRRSLCVCDSVWWWCFLFSCCLYVCACQCDGLPNGIREAKCVIENNHD